MAEQEKKPILDTPESILRDAVLRSNELDAEALAALSRRDTVAYRRKLTERAKLIASLSAKVEEAIAGGQSFPEGGLGQLEILSELAEEALKNRGLRSSFAPSVFLTRRGSLGDEPNSLEELVGELYPPSPETKR